MIKQQEPYKYRIIIAVLEHEGLNADVSISYLYDKLRARTRRTSNKQMQQYVGSIIAYANLRLVSENKEIVPGALKRTYRLVLKQNA